MGNRVESLVRSGGRAVGEPVMPADPAIGPCTNELAPDGGSPLIYFAIVSREWHAICTLAVDEGAGTGVSGGAVPGAEVQRCGWPVVLVEGVGVGFGENVADDDPVSFALRVGGVALVALGEDHGAPPRSW
jgi:hypothetical protein